MSEIWVYSESASVSDEVATAGSQLGSTLGWETVALELDNPRDGVHSPSRKLLLKASAPLAGRSDSTAQAIALAASRLKPAAILLGATRFGREVAARLAVKLKVSCLGECSELSCDGKTLAGVRTVYAGRVRATVSVSLPCVATVKLGVYPQFSGVSSKIEEFELGEVKTSLKLVDFKKKQASSVDLKSARVIVSVGRGLRKKDDLELIEKLAGTLDGAVGCSRPISSDLGWLPEEHHIGLTGVTVHPDLYLAIGISGQLQHIAGIKDSKVIAAINTDRDAPIFQACDYGVVGDLYKIVPELLKQLSS